MFKSIICIAWLDVTLCVILCLMWYNKGLSDVHKNNYVFNFIKKMIFLNYFPMVLKVSVKLKRKIDTLVFLIQIYVLNILVYSMIN